MFSYDAVLHTPSAEARDKVAHDRPQAFEHAAAAARGQRIWGGRGRGGARGSLSRGKILHTRHHKSEIPLENATDNLLGMSSEHPLEK